MRSGVCSLPMVKGREEKERRRDCQEEGQTTRRGWGGGGATVPWQQAVEAGKMAAGDTTPGQIWSTAPSSGLLSPHISTDDAGRTIYRQRAETPSPVSLMCRAGMSDAGLGPNTQTKPRGSFIHSHTPHLLTLISLIPPSLTMS